MVRAVKDPEFDIDAVPLDDQAVFDLLGRGDTMGVFQLESPPMRALLRSLAPTSFERRLRRDRAVPAGADERQHALRLRRPQERPQAGRATSTPTPRRCSATRTA